MEELEIWLLAIGLAMDCFTVSIASGIILKKMDWCAMGKMAFFFGMFQAVMPIIGWICTCKFSSLIEHYDHWIAFALLVFLGGRMIWEDIKGANEKAGFNPSHLKIILTLAVATSIDALAVGISFTCVGMITFASIVYPVCIIGLVSFLFSWLGSFIGVFVGRRFNWPVGIIGGLILIGIGCRILLEHLEYI